MSFHRRAIRIVRTCLGLVSNNRELLTQSEYFTDRVPQSLLTDYHRIDDVPWDGAPSGVDAEIRIVDTPGLAPAIALEPDRVRGGGDWPAAEPATSAGATPCSGTWGSSSATRSTRSSGTTTCGRSTRARWWTTRGTSGSFPAAPERARPC